MSVGDWIWPVDRDLPEVQQWPCHSFQLVHVLNNPGVPTEWPSTCPHPVLFCTGWTRSPHWCSLLFSFCLSVPSARVISSFTLLSCLIMEIIHTCCKKTLNIEKYKEESHCTYIFSIQPELIIWKFFFPRVSFHACFNSWINTECEFWFFLLILYCRHFLCCQCFRNILMAAWDSVLFTYLLF